MSGDEGLVFVLSMVIGPACWIVWLVRILAVQQLRPGKSPVPLLTLLATLAMCGLILGAVLLKLSAPDVRDAPVYVLFYFFLGLAWVKACEWLFAYAGVSVRDDVIERRNAAALPAASGALVGATCCFAGANIGSGPGWWVVVFSSALATSALGFVWLALDRMGQVADMVTIERDRAAGWRLGAMLVACGLILGRAVAGNWVGSGETIADFMRLGWPVIPLTAAGIVLDRVFTLTPEQPRASVFIAGVLPALIYLFAAGLHVVATGWPA